MKREKLELYRDLCMEISELESEKVALAQGFVPSSWPIKDIHGSGLPNDVVSQMASKLFNLSEMLAGKINELIKLRVEIENAVEKLPLRSRLIIRLHYIDGLTWDEVAEKMECSYRHVFRLRNKILDKYFPEDKNEALVIKLNSSNDLLIVS